MTWVTRCKHCGKTGVEPHKETCPEHPEYRPVEVGGEPLSRLEPSDIPPRPRFVAGELGSGDALAKHWGVSDDPS